MNTVLNTRAARGLPTGLNRKRTQKPSLLKGVTILEFRPKHPFLTPALVAVLTVAALHLVFLALYTLSK